MRAMKGQVHFEWEMEVDRTSQERKYTERETHQETQKIKVRPGHTTPRAQHLTNATCRCGARAGIRDAGPASCYLDPFGVDSVAERRRRRRMTADFLPPVLMIARMQDFSEALGQIGRPENLRQEQNRPA